MRRTIHINIWLVWRAVERAERVVEEELKQIKIELQVV